MIEAKFERGVDYLAMSVRGHASFAELGKDPVCAGASALAMTVAQCIQTMSDAGRLKKAAHITIRNGRVSVVAKPRAESYDEAMHTMYVGEIGMRLLEAAYPDHVHLTPFVSPGETPAEIEDSPTIRAEMGSPTDGQEVQI